MRRMMRRRLPERRRRVWTRESRRSIDGFPSRIKETNLFTLLDKMGGNGMGMFSLDFEESTGGVEIDIPDIRIGDEVYDGTLNLSCGKHAANLLLENKANDIVNYVWSNGVFVASSNSAPKRSKEEDPAVLPVII